MIGALIKRDVRRGFTGAAWLPIAFFLLVTTLVPFAVGPDPRLLRMIAAGTLWIAALTAALLPVERLVEPDRANGVLDQLTLSGLTEETIALCKIIAHWLTFGPILILASVPAAALLSMDAPSFILAAVSLAIGTPAIAALAVGVAAITAGLPRAGALTGLLLLPLTLPLLIFAVPNALLLEASIALLLTTGAPFVAGAAIRAART